MTFAVPPPEPPTVWLQCFSGRHCDPCISYERLPPGFVDSSVRILYNAISTDGFVTKQHVCCPGEYYSIFSSSNTNQNQNCYIRSYQNLMYISTNGF